MTGSIIIPCTCAWTGGVTWIFMDETATALQLQKVGPAGEKAGRQKNSGQQQDCRAREPGAASEVTQFDFFVSLPPLDKRPRHVCAWTSCAVPPVADSSHVYARPNCFQQRSCGCQHDRAGAFSLAVTTQPCGKQCRTESPGLKDQYRPRTSCADLGGPGSGRRGYGRFS